MNDEFLALFGAPLLDDEDEAPSERAATVGGPVLGTVIASFERDCKVQLPDGQQVLVNQTVFEAVEHEAIVPIFDEGGGWWSLINPAWPLPGGWAGARALKRGASVVFAISAYDEVLDGLVGTVDEHAAFAPRRWLPWPASCPTVDLRPTIGRTVKLTVADPLALPLELAAPNAVKKLSATLPPERLFSLRTLASMAPDVRTRVVGIGEHLNVSFFGTYYPVFPEDRGWTEAAAPRVGQLVEAQLSVDMGAGAFFLCLRCAHHPEWAEVRRRYPIGTVIERARNISMTNRGMVVAIPDPDLNIVAMVPVFQYGPPAAWRHEGVCDVPLPLRVIGHSDDRCVLLLDIEPYVQRRWRSAALRVGSTIPLVEYKWSALEPEVQWDVGCRASTTQCLKAGQEWGIVREVDAASRHLLLDPVGSVRLGRADSDGDAFAVVMDDGTRVLLAEGHVPSSPDDPKVVETILTSVRFGPNGMEPVVSVASTPRELAYSELQRRMETQEPVSARVQSQVKGGLIVEISTNSLLPEGAPEPVGRPVFRAFAPASQLDTRPVRDIKALVGQVLDVLVIALKRGASSIVVSRKALLMKHKEARRSEIFSKIRVGDVVVGRVKNIVNYGAFLDLGGIDGLLHVADMSHGKAVIPRELLSLEQTLEVVVLHCDVVSERVGLGLKQLMPDPWVGVDEKYSVGAYVTGTIGGATEGGLMVQLEPGVDGFIPTVELSWDRRPKIAILALSAGDRVDAVVLGVDEEGRRVNLSRRRAYVDPLAAFVRLYPLGAVLSARVDSVVNFGVFARLTPGVTGLVHTSALGPDGPALLAKLKKGDGIRVEVIQIDIATRRLGIKLLSLLPPRQSGAPMVVGAVVVGTVVEMASGGLLVEIDDHGIGRVANALVVPFLMDAKDLGAGTRVLVEVLCLGMRELAHDLGLREILPRPVAPRPAAAAPVLHMSPPAHSVRTKSGKIVSLGELSSRYKIARSDIGKLYSECIGPVPAQWDEPLLLSFAEKLLGALVDCGMVGQSLARAEPAPSIAASSQPGSATEHDPGLDGAPLGDAECSRDSTEWANIAAAGLASGGLPHGTASVPVGQQPRPDTGRHHGAVGSLPEIGGGGAVVQTYSSTAVVLAAGRSGATPPEAPPPPGTAAEDRLPRVAGLAAISRILRARGAERGDADEDDERREGDDTDIDGGEDPAGASAVRAGFRDIEPRDGQEPPPGSGNGMGFGLRLWTDCLPSELGHAEVTAALAHRGLTALAGVVDRRIPVGRIPTAAGALSELAAAQRVFDQTGDESAVARCADQVLRCVAAIPNDVVPWMALARVTPSEWLLRNADDVEAWVRSNGRQALDTPSIGHAAALASASRSRGDLRRAHELLGEWLRHGDCADFRGERKELALLYEQEVLATGRFFDRWTRREGPEVGRGSFSLVVPVLDAKTGRAHALKHAILLDAVGADRRASEMLFDREARMVQDLLGVAGVPSFVDRPSAHVLVCEWVDGCNLSELLAGSCERSPWAPGAAAKLGARLAAVLRDVTGRLPGFVHNDLAPRNIMMKEGYPADAVLIDLGLASHTDRSVSSIVDDLDLGLRTTYQAPEVREGARPTQQSDMYSLGLILLEAATGHPVTIGQKALEDAVDRLLFGGRGGAVRSLSRMIRDLLSAEPGRRPSTWLDVAHQLEEIPSD